MTADIPSWMKPDQKGLGLGELGAELGGDPGAEAAGQARAPHADPAPSDPRKPMKPAPRKAPQKTKIGNLTEIEDAEVIDAVPALDASNSDLGEAAYDDGILAAVLPKLRGIRSVTIRVFGGNTQAGPALLQQLRLRGLDVKLSGITQIVPPPISRISVRYQGVDATITLAPDFGG